jgi:hypothetical protein
MKAHLRVTHDAEDDLIEALTAAAVAYLDGWTGVLGRCIGSQVWRVTLDSAGAFALPMPDVTAASADYGQGAVALVVNPYGAGPLVEVTGPCDVTFTCQMRGPMAALVAQAVKLLVGHWYQNREAVGAAMAETPLAFDMILSAIRWRKV